MRIILIPISILYSIIIYFRNIFYDTGLLKSCKISKPVISIGNITTGGTGKTPLTILIAKYFLSRGKTVGIVSRGYKRNSDDIRIVCDGKNVIESIQHSGDELILISNELLKYYPGNFFIAAGRNRVDTSNLLIKKFNPDIIVLDDAFQHRKIKRDLDIVIVDAGDFNKNKFLNTFTLPSGKLREGFHNLRRAGLLIQNDKAFTVNLISKLETYTKNIIRMRYKTEYLMDYKNGILEKVNSPAILFSGIANDESFIKMVKDSGINAPEVIKFSDHHNYSPHDINFLIQKYSGNKIFITTEKDFVKIKQFNNFITNYPVYFLKIEIDITKNENILHNKLDELIK